MCKFFLLFLFIFVPMLPLFGQPTNSSPLASSAINAVGVDLLHQTAHADQNALLSPYSIETALAMAYAGADGKTRDEMASVLHLHGDAAGVARAFAGLQSQLDAVVQRSVDAAESAKGNGQRIDPIALNIANRLFGQKGYDFRPEFLDLVKNYYNAPLEIMDFRKDPGGATRTINDWVAEKTRKRIENLIPAGALNDLTRLVLVNAVYLKAPWANEFPERATQPLPFHARGGEAAADVPTMTIQESFGYAKEKGVAIVSVPYKGGDLQFLIILPDDINGLATAEAALTAEKLAGWASLSNRTVKLFLPKFKMEPPTLPLGDALQKLGMTTAFDNPPGSANFDRMAPRRPDDYLYISKVFHKTFMSVDEKGTEAAAATAVHMFTRSAAMRPAEPVEVRVDHPFIFAIQHRASGACLFLGHVVDPR